MSDDVTCVRIDAITFDSETQPRAAILSDTVASYREAIEGGAVMPPVTLFFDGRRHWIGDGFHRVMAYRAAGFREVDAHVYPGGKRDAILHAVGANADHGLPRTKADKRRAVEIVLRDEEWRQWTDVVIADKCRVHPNTVGNIRNEMYPTSHNVKSTRKTKNGRTMNTTNIGKAKSSKKPKATPPAPKSTPAPPAPTPVQDNEPEEPEEPQNGHREAVAGWFQPNDLADALKALRTIHARYAHVDELSEVWAVLDRLNVGVA